MAIGLLTSGGDCPGLNAVIRAAVLKGERIHSREFVGIRDGFRGLIEGDVFPLPRASVRGISTLGGTILGTARANPLEKGADHLKKVMEENNLDSLIAIGGEGTLNAAEAMHEEGIKVVGVPKTIDNDLGATDYTFGFDTAVQIAAESIDRLRTTAESHHRCMVVEVMGRHAGWIALHAGMASGAHAILIPEVPQPLDQVCDWVQNTRKRGRAPIVVVAEGFSLEGEDLTDQGKDEQGRPRLGGVGEALAPLIEEATGVETRSTTLGHLQRGGSPTAFDRVLATRFGNAAVDAVVDEAWGTMVALDGTDIVRVKLAEATQDLKTVPRHRFDEAAVLFG